MTKNNLNLTNARRFVNTVYSKGINPVIFYPEQEFVKKNSDFEIKINNLLLKNHHLKVYNDIDSLRKYYFKNKLTPLVIFVPQEYKKIWKDLSMIYLKIRNVMPNFTLNNIFTLMPKENYSQWNEFSNELNSIKKIDYDKIIPIKYQSDQEFSNYLYLFSNYLYL